MFKLIKLEIYKSQRVGDFIKRILLTNLGILIFLVLLSYVPMDEGEIALSSYNEASYSSLLAVINQFVRIVYIVSSGVILAKLVIEEFRTKTISVLFMYPINRKKLLIAKLLLVVMYTFISIVVANILLTAIMVGLNQMWPFLSDTLTTGVLVDHSINVLIQAVAACGIGLIPLFFGMRKYSTPTTIVSAIIIAALLNSTMGDTATLSDILIFPIATAVLGFIIAYMSIRNIEHIDVLK